ncbi:MAG: hypothetical protein ABJF10_26205 [Chthoniobacter sp.]|uniref:hypothetical protein n=1 Tax=Chthoniobacter sp. TaxID=2510640 RepID=UPI0032A16677
MNNSPPSQSLSFYAKAYARYIVPTWLFPVYFIAWGFACERLKPPYIILWFFLTVGPPFFGSSLWANRARKHMPYWPFVFLTLIVPFGIFVAIGLLLAIGQPILKGNGL